MASPFCAVLFLGKVYAKVPALLVSVGSFPYLAILKEFGFNLFVLFLVHLIH